LLHDNRFDCLPCIAAQQEGIPKGIWNNVAKQGYAEKTFGIPKGTYALSPIAVLLFCSNQTLSAAIHFLD
jgi:hypothetical protein